MITAVVLAAGTSSRLGRPKQLLPLGDRPVIGHVVDRVLASSVDAVLVVTGHAGERVRDALKASAVAFVENPDFAAGQATSLRAGIRAAGESEAVVVVLGDQPGIGSHAVDGVIARWRETGAPIVAATYGGRRSHPMLFARQVFPDLLRIEGDTGAREVIRRYDAQVAEFETGAPEPPADIDTEAAYEALLAIWTGS